MRNIAVRISIAVVTFVVGTVAAFLIGPSRHHPRPQVIDRVSTQYAAPLKEERYSCDQSTPEVKWIFINCAPATAQGLTAQGWYYASVVIFYENGDWVRVPDTVRRDGEAFVFSRADSFGADVGKWEVNDDGTFKVTIENQRHFARDATETWLIGSNEAFLTKQAGWRLKIATRFLQIGDTQLVTGAREDGQSSLPLKQLFDPRRIRRDESEYVY
jgi:hypothetical protein